MAGGYVDGIQLGEEVYIQYVWCNPNCVYVHGEITLHVYKPKINSGKLDSLKKKMFYLCFTKDFSRIPKANVSYLS